MNVQHNIIEVIEERTLKWFEHEDGMGQNSKKNYWSGMPRAEGERRSIDNIGWK